MTIEEQINLSFAVKVQMQALLETLEKFPKGMHEKKKRINDFLNWMELEANRNTFGFIDKESYQFIEATEKIQNFANSIKISLQNEI